MQYRDAHPIVLETVNSTLRKIRMDVKGLELAGEAKFDFINFQILSALSAVDNVLNLLVQEFPDNSQNDLYLTLAEEFDSITASIVELDDYQLDYFYEVHDPETATDLWNNIYAAEREKDPAKNLKAINKKKSK